VRSLEEFEVGMDVAVVQDGRILRRATIDKRHKNGNWVVGGRQFRPSGEATGRSTWGPVTRIKPWSLDVANEQRMQGKRQRIETLQHAVSRLRSTDLSEASIDAATSALEAAAAALRGEVKP